MWGTWRGSARAPWSMLPTRSSYSQPLTPCTSPHTLLPLGLKGTVPYVCLVRAFLNLMLSVLRNSAFSLNLIFYFSSVTAEVTAFRMMEEDCKFKAHVGSETLFCENRILLRGPGSLRRPSFYNLFLAPLFRGRVPCPWVLLPPACSSHSTELCHCMADEVTSLSPFPGASCPHRGTEHFNRKNITSLGASALSYASDPSKPLMVPVPICKFRWLEENVFDGS